MTQSPPTGELVARDIYEVANQLQSYVGPDTPEPLAAFLMREGAEAAKLADALTTLERELEEERALSERLKLEAQGHAMEARTANSTIYEIYQVLSGGRGEPGNWNGAEPAREYVTASQAEVERLKEAMTAIDNAWCQFINCRNDQTDDPAYNAAEEQRNVDALGDAVERARAALQVEESKG